jgi:hypothetical protein
MKMSPPSIALRVLKYLSRRMVSMSRDRRAHSHPFRALKVS